MTSAPSMAVPCRHKLTASKRAHAIQKLSAILQQRPSGRHSPTFSSLDLLPAALMNWIRKSNSLSVCMETTSAPSHTSSVSASFPLSLPLQPSVACGLVHMNKLLQTREGKLRGGGAKQVGVALLLLSSYCYGRICTGCWYSW